MSLHTYRALIEAHRTYTDEIERRCAEVIADHEYTAAHAPPAVQPDPEHNPPLDDAGD